MRKIISIFLCLICITMLMVGCSSKKDEANVGNPTTKPSISETDKETNSEEVIEKFEEPDNAGIDDGALYFGLNGAHGESLRLMIPKVLEPHCFPKYSSHFEEGWIKITVSAKDENHDMFTIYASSNNTYEQFKNEKNYKVLCDDGVFTVVWFEHELASISPEASESVEMLKQNFTLIQESVVIKATEN